MEISYVARLLIRSALISFLYYILHWLVPAETMPHKAVSYYPEQENLSANKDIQYSEDALDTLTSGRY